MDGLRVLAVRTYYLIVAKVGVPDLFGTPFQISWIRHWVCCDYVCLYLAYCVDCAQCVSYLCCLIFMNGFRQSYHVSLLETSRCMNKINDSKY